MYAKNQEIGGDWIISSISAVFTIISFHLLALLRSHSLLHDGPLLHSIHARRMTHKNTKHVSFLFQRITINPTNDNARSHTDSVAVKSIKRQVYSTIVSEVSALKKHQ